MKAYLIKMRRSIVAVIVIVGILVGLIVGYYIGYNTGYYSRLSSPLGNSLTQPVGLQQYSEILVGPTTISQPAGYYTQYSFTLNYPGYIKVIVLSSTTTNTYIQISGYSDQGISYSSGKVNVGDSGSLSYPVLPGSVTVDIGNSNLFNGASEQIEIIYVYYAA